MNDEVVCLLCGLSFRALGGHLVRTHNIDIYEYRRRFPDAPTESEETLKAYSAAAIERWEDPNYARCVSEGNKGKVISEEVRQRMRELHTGNEYALGHVHTEEAKQRMSALATERMKDPRLRMQIAESVSKALMGHETSEETKQKIREANLGNENALGFKHTEKAKRLISKAKLGNEYALGYVHTAEARRLMSKAQLGKEVSEETRQLMSEITKELWKDPEYAKCISEGVSKSLKERWREPEFAQYMAEAQHQKPNERELQLQSVLDKHFPGKWKYVGDNQFGIEGRYPDFVNTNGKNQVIEIFGYFWHDPDYFPNRPTEEELIAHYKKYGFDCLVFWEYDVYNEEEVVTKVKEVCHASAGFDQFRQAGS